MCDTLCVVGAGRTLFAKNSDRPASEPQVVERHERRAARSAVRTTYLELDDAGAYALVGSRPAWMWSFEHGVNEHRVAIGNEKIYTVDDPHAAPPALTGADLVRLGLERGATADDAVDVMTTLLEQHGQGGSGEEPATCRTGRRSWSPTRRVVGWWRRPPGHGRHVASTTAPRSRTACSSARSGSARRLTSRPAPTSARGATRKPVFPPDLPAEAALTATWQRFARLRDRIEADSAALAVVRSELRPVEDALWAEADEVTGDAQQRSCFTARAWPRVHAALTRLGV